MKGRLPDPILNRPKQAYRAPIKSTFVSEGLPPYLKEMLGEDKIKEAGIFNLFDLNRFRDLLDRQIQKLITYDTSSWDIDYVCKPSIFIPNKESDFYSSNKDICDYECNYIINNQKEDGTWNVTWSWDAYSREWSISENWWKSDIIIRNIKFVKEFSSQI